MIALVVAAHPDDEVLGCGGVMYRMAKEGNDVHIVVLGEGLTSRDSETNKTTAAAVAMLHKSAELAADLIGARSVETFRLPDNRFDTVAMLDIVRMIEEAIKRTKPEIVYTHHGGDLNIDHALTARAVLTATRPVAGSPIREVYAFEVLSSTEWSFGMVGEPFKPDTFLTIDLEQKLRILEAYESELREFPHPRSPDAVSALAQLRGSSAGLLAAEAFQTVRRVG